MNRTLQGRVRSFTPFKVLVLDQWIRQTNPFLTEDEDQVLVTDLANFNRWTKSCWKATPANETILELTRTRWQMYNSGVILGTGISIPLLYRKWAQSMKQHGAPKCDQMYLNMLIHTGELDDIGLRLVNSTSQQSCVVHMATERRSHLVFERRNSTIYHQYKWCKVCVERLLRHVQNSTPLG